MTLPTLALNDGHSIPQLGFGLWQVPAAQTAEVTATALRLGYPLVDGAAIYGNEIGQGEGIRASGIAREKIFVTTKVWNSDQGYDTTLRAVAASLDRLGMERVELCLIHWPVPAQDRYLDTWRALIRLREEGMVETRREAQSIYYSLVPGPAFQVVQTLHGIYCGPPRAPLQRNGGTP